MMEEAQTLDVDPTTKSLHARVHETLNRLSSTGALPTMPSAVTRALAVIRDPACDLEEICAIVETDVGIAARVLRLANSPMYTRGKRYATLQDALVAVGVRALGEILMTASMGKLYASPDPVVRGLWDHALATAIACRLLAPRFQQDPDQAFMIGLFHDLGSFAFYSTDRAGFDTIAAMRVQETRCELERQWYGFDHAEAGAVLAVDWGFPDTAVDAIRWHHEPAEATVGRSLAKVAHLADALTRSIALGGAGEQIPPIDALEAALSEEERIAFGTQVEQELHEQRKLFA